MVAFERPYDDGVPEAQRATRSAATFHIESRLSKAPCRLARGEVGRPGGEGVGRLDRRLWCLAPFRLLVSLLGMPARLGRHDYGWLGTPCPGEKGHHDSGVLPLLCSSIVATSSACQGQLGHGFVASPGPLQAWHLSEGTNHRAKPSCQCSLVRFSKWQGHLAYVAEERRV